MTAQKKARDTSRADTTWLERADRTPCGLDCCRKSRDRLRAPGSDHVHELADDQEESEGFYEIAEEQ